MSFQILIIDDSEENRAILKVFLHREGYRIHEADCGGAGLSLCRSVRPDIVLLDIVMPDMDGFAVFDALQQDEEVSDIPVIFLTAQTEARDKIRGIEMGAVDYITKPFDKGEVLARVRNQLKIRELQVSLMAAHLSLVEKQRRIDEDLRAAGEIQKGLVAGIPRKLGPLSLGWQFVPCEKIGGDILYAQNLDEDHSFVYMLDVSGHGVPAALVSVSVFQSLSVSSGSVLKKKLPDPPFYAISPPGKVLEHLDDEYPMDRFDKFFTMAYLIVNRRTGGVRYSNAAHPAPVIFRSGGEMEALTEGGTVIGMGGLVPFTEGEARLMPGDRLYLYTDGIIERRSAEGDFFGEERLFAILREKQHASIEDVGKAVLDAVLAFGSAAPDDDISFLGVSYDPEDM